MSKQGGHKDLHARNLSYVELSKLYWQVFLISDFIAKVY